MKNKLILLASDQFGKGDPELGETVLETFFNLLKQEEQKPAAIFCMNRGVLALTEASFASVHLKELAEQGVEVFACKTCVDFYKVEDKLMSGTISSMKHFLELSGQYEVVTIS